MLCPHADGIRNLQPPKLSQSVHREECTQCFDNQDLPAGIDVCLSCFNGGCLDNDRRHAQNHVQKSGHQFTLNIKRKAKPSAQRGESEEPPAKMAKLAIVEEREEDKYDQFSVAKCWVCDPEKGLELPELSSDPQVKAIIDGVLQAMSSARQSEVQAWEEEIIPCEHTLCLEQVDARQVEQAGAHCNSCDLNQNLWLCMTCGSLGCGRQLYGGLGGNGHGLAHFQQTGHPVSVKLGTITAEGAADIYCYVCDDSKQDPELARHLSTFGINIRNQTKTEKNMTELQLEHNLTYDFSLTDEKGQALEPVFGPGLTGLSNLGNSCYMASVLQTIFSLPAFQVRYSELAKNHPRACTVPLPAECVECQMHKVADGLLSGRYSHPANYSGNTQYQTQSNTNVTPASDPLQHTSPTPVFQTGVRPMGFKSLIGKGHEEFSTMKQQDSEEFFTHLLTVLRRDMHKYKDRSDQDPTTIFSHGLEQRLQCNDCKKVRYRNDVMDSVSIVVPVKEKGKDADGKTLYEDVPLLISLEALLSPEALEYACPECKKNVYAMKQTRFASFPQVLVVHAKKSQLVNWVPTKLDIPLILPPNDDLEFTANQLGQGLQPGESELPDDSPTSSASAPSLPEFNAAALEMLQSMGFPLVRCQKALLATGNESADAAMEWLFGHMEDPGIDEPIQLGVGGGNSGGGATEPSADQIAQIADMGFTHAQAKKALRETNGNPERAIEWLFNHPDDMGEDSAPAPPSSDAPSSSSSTPAQFPGSKDIPVRYTLKAFISHKGPSVHSGHYVAHIKTNVAGEERWVLFNDEKVVKADEESVRELKKGAYLYIFERV